MTKNQAKDVEYVDLGIVAQALPIGIIEAIHRLPEYTTACEVVSKTAELIKVKIDTFLKVTKSSNHVWSQLEKFVDERQIGLTKRILQ